MKTARLVVLGVALSAGAAAMFLMRGTPQPVVVEAAAPPPQIATDEVLTASHELNMGTLVTDPDLTWTQWPRAAIGAGMLKRSEFPNIIPEINGSVSRGTFLQGEPIRREKLVKGPNSGFMSAILPAGSRAVAINIDTGGATTAGGFILPNDHVDVIRTVQDEANGQNAGAFRSETLLANVRVLAIGQNVQEKNGERVVTGSNATLEVEPRQGEVLIQAQRSGQLSLVLRSMLDSAQTQTADEDSGLTVVRFGVAQSLGRR